jgi:hypothetical protein
MISSFSQVPGLFKDQPENCILTIEKNSDSYSFSVRSQSSSSATDSTLSCLKEIIGTARLRRICQQPEIGIDIEEIDQNTLLLTKNVVRKIFVGLMDVKKVDFDEIIDPMPLEEKFQKLTISNTFEDIESFLMGRAPTLQRYAIDKAATSGKGLEGLIERVHVAMYHHFQVMTENDTKAAKVRDAEMLTSRLADRELREGSVVHLADGYFQVDKIFVNGGAYISVLKDMSEIMPPKIVCRGTAMRRTATGALLSGLNDVQLEIGTMGIKRIWPALSQYLIENQISAVTILGKSLGGAHAQELAILAENMGVEVKKLITYCSVGVGQSINNIFKDSILSNRNSPFKIQIIRNASYEGNQVDYIPAIGGVHLGEGTSVEKCAVEVCYIQPGEQSEYIYPNETGFIKLIKNFLRSFGTPHCRQTTLTNFSWKKIEDRGEINEHLRIGNRLERVRSLLAYFIHFLTLTRVNGESFTSFVLRQPKNNKAPITQEIN